MKLEKQWCKNNACSQRSDAVSLLKSDLGLSSQASFKGS
jgi:hypothetical protein